MNSNVNQLILMRGLPGSGKSSWIKDKGYEIYTLCADTLRLMFSAPNPQISQKDNSRVWKLLFEMLEERMKTGSLTVIDALHLNWKSIKCYLPLCEKYQYLLKIVDFSDVPLENCLERNKVREDYKYVSEKVIIKMHNKIKSSDNNKIGKFF